MNTFLSLAAARCSVRSYTDRTVEPKKIEHCLEAARLAPSACNAQPWKFIAVTNPELKNEIAAYTFDPLLSFNRFTHTAPVLIVIVTEKPLIVAQIGAALKNRDFNLIDVGIAAEHICLAAADEGLGTCMIGWFNERAVKKLLHIPSRKRIGLLITLGYPAEGYARPKVRKSKNDVISFNQY
ncbi:MAG: nitroreductase family protein [Ignavibacteriales bacterium]|nr:nitroreductase family protein [Ignavibacteriales bacterium]